MGTWEPVLQYIAKLKILCYFTKINQSFTQEIKSYIKRTFHLLALVQHMDVLFLRTTFKQLQMKKVRTWEILFQLAIDRP